MNDMNDNKKIIEMFNLLPYNFNGRSDRGRVFSVKGIGPCIHTMQGGSLQPKILKINGKWR